ncbi:MAG TPA: polysaccharide biosynthesis C-terminal domain-containing protein, partial [Methylotenera sp.]|nr:polysaccharide biosynthesis C-terminal domain-containing protein [Methylotenera sp.]
GKLGHGPEQQGICICRSVFRLQHVGLLRSSGFLTHPFLPGGFSEQHQAMVTGNRIEPVFETSYVMNSKLFKQAFENLHHRILALFIVIKKAKLQKLHWNWPFFVMILKQSLPFAMLYMLMACYNRIDSVMIERLLPKDIASAQAGIYASAFRLLDALVMIAYLFSVILMPLFSKMIKEKEDLRPITRTSFSFLYFFAITAVVLLLCYKMPILNLLYNDHVQESANVFSILIPGIIPISFTYIFGSLLTANGNMKLLNITAIAGICVNVAVNLILIPQLQARGAAIASLSTQSVVSLLQIIIAFKELKIPFSVIPWGSCFLYAILFIPLAKYSTYILHCNVIISLLIMGCIAIAIGFGTRLIKLKEAGMFKGNNNVIKS